MSLTEPATFDRDGHARCYAKRHVETDAGVREICYLPTDSPPREIRFVEVNESISETTPLEPVDFGVDPGSADSHTLFVLDATPSQWKAIREGRLSLPTGWTLEEMHRLK